MSSNEPCKFKLKFLIMESLEKHDAELKEADAILPEAVEPESSLESVEIADEMQTEAEPQQRVAPSTKAEVLDALKAICASEALTDELIDESNRLKRDYYNLEHELQRKAFEEYKEAGGDVENYVAEADSTEGELKELLNAVKERKAALREALEAEMARNAQLKRDIISEIEKIAADTDNVNRHYPRIKELTSDFKNIGVVPQEEATKLWKSYTAAVELFYDQWKVNKELRDYDFKKNLAEKQLLLTEAEGLADEEDVIVAFKRLQDLHDKWREIGPVQKEIREELWNKFKDASAVVNKRYQTHFEERKARERENEAGKTALCELVEAIDFEKANSFTEWNALTKEIIEAQEKWKTYGFASRKVNNELFSRFRSTCDKFFTAKAEYFKKAKDTQAENLARKLELCEKAEALKESTEWRKTADAINKLKDEWRTIGAVGKKQSDVVWRRFMDACDYFFDQRKKATSSVRKAENANLKVKKEIVDELLKLNSPEDATEQTVAVERINELRQLWQQTGHVPFKEKDALHDTYRKVVGELFDKFDMRQSRARMENFEASVNETTDQGKLSRDREKMMRALDRLRQELKTYQNNLGFLSSKSKSGESMLREMERKMQRLQSDIVELEKKITIIDNKL